VKDATAVMGAWRWFRVAALGLLALLAIGASPAAQAHEMSMAEMELRETSKGEFRWLWTATDDRSTQREMTPRWPQGCRAEGRLLSCGEAGLQGSLSIDGVGKRYSAALVKVIWLDGQTRVYTLTASQPTVQLYGSADDSRGMGDIAWAYVVLGFEHILSGIDHLLFVISLLFLVGFQRKLIWTISAFTVAHSLTLASAALGWLTLRSAPVEACIALSIVLVAVEALRKNSQPETLSRRWPAMVAFLFGLVHGLGFAGALQEIGLPQNHLAVALLTFNIGVELGQLVTVAAAWALARWAQRQAWAARLRTPALYAIGSMAAYWSWLRVATILA
jgi:hydrogenase/urease accessory protein HupE